MISIKVQNEELDLKTESNVTFTLQVSDIGDISNLKSSYASGITALRTPKNQQIAEQLGITSDTSRLPYLKVKADASKNGISIFRNGIATFRETNDSGYNIYVQDGIIHLFNAIDGILFGQEISLPEIEHDKNCESVVNSFENPYYRYLIGSYGGEMTTFRHVTCINIDYQIPSVRLKYLWEKLFEYIGFTYEGEVFDTNDFKDAFISYPKENGETVDTILVEYSMDDERSIQFYRYFNKEMRLAFFPLVPWLPMPPFSPAPFFEFYHITGKVHQILQFGYLSKVGILESGIFRFEMNFNIICNYKVKLTPLLTANYEYTALVEVKKNGMTWHKFKTDGEDRSIAIPCDAGDEIEFVVKKDESFILIQQKELVEMTIKSWGGININVSETNFTQYNFIEAFKDLTPKQLLKEVQHRFALIPIIKDNHVVFYNINEILKRNEAVDWTSKYVKRTSEKYTAGNYAQNNFLKMRYINQDDNYSDGNIFIDNVNLPLSKNLLESKFYAPSETYNNVKLSSNVTYPFKDTLSWNREISERDGEVEVTYKPEKDRFYWLKSNTVSAEPYLFCLISDNLGEEVFTEKLNVADVEMTTMDYFVEKYHKGHKVMLDDVKIHEITLNLSTNDIESVDFAKLYYFHQEQQFYKLNRLIVSEEKLPIGEFIRIKVDKL